MQTVWSILIGAAIGFALGCFELFALEKLVRGKRLRWLWFLIKMAAYFAVFYGMLQWSLVHFFACVAVSLFMLFMGVGIIYARGKRSQ